MDPITLLRALDTLPRESFHTILVGDGPDRSAVEEELRRLDLGAAVELVGNTDDVPSLLASADVFVLSSAAEGLPISILEAMSAECRRLSPPASAGYPSSSCTTKPGCSCRLEIREALAEALGLLARDGELRRRLGTAGRARLVGQFELASVHRAHLSLYSAELAKRGLPLPWP